MSKLIGVYKRYTTGTVKRHFTAKRTPHAYFIGEDGKIHTKRITRWQAFILGFQVHHRLTVHCTGCGHKFFKLVKKRSNKVECPYCETLG